jgi:hypothetical protein
MMPLNPDLFLPPFYHRRRSLTIEVPGMSCLPCHSTRMAKDVHCAEKSQWKNRPSIVSPFNRNDSSKRNHKRLFVRVHEESGMR